MIRLPTKVLTLFAGGAMKMGSSREELLIERGLSQGAAGLTDRPKEPSEASLEEIDAEKLGAPTMAPKSRLLWLPTGAALLAFATALWLRNDINALR